MRVDHVELDSLKQTQGQQSIDECAPRVPASGVDDKTGGLIYHHELVVHVQQFKADVGLGQCFGRGGRGGLDQNRVALSQSRRGRSHRATDRHASLGDPPLQFGTRQRECLGEKTVEPAATRIPGDDETNRLPYQSLDLTCPLAFTSMSTRARS